MRVRAIVMAAALLFSWGAPARAALEPGVTFSPPPPGTVVESRVVYLSLGERIDNRWRAVLSKKLIGTSDGTTWYQWYLSVYEIEGSTYHLEYRSPRAPVPFDTVERASGQQSWFPAQSGHIVGAGAFMGPGVEQLVVESYQAGADCGSARVDVFLYDPATKFRVLPALSVENACDLSATIIDERGVAALALTGPYYAPGAPLCCATKPRVTAIFRFRASDQTWTQSPHRYFKVLKNGE